MRFASYIVAVLVAAGLIYFISQSPSSVQNAQGDPAAENSALVYPDVDAGQLETADAQLVTLRVPEMHCPFACYPAVKKALEAEPGVVGVDLAEQKVDGVIDNPEVKIQVSSGFDAESAIDTLAKAGFAESSKVQ